MTARLIFAPDKTSLSKHPHCAYISGAGLPAMAINVLWNKQSGPGGGTRRLHHFSLIWQLPARQMMSAYTIRLKDWGRNRIDACGKDSIFVRYGTRRYRAM